MTTEHENRKISFSLHGKRDDLVLFVDRIMKQTFKVKPNSLIVDLAIVNLSVGDNKYSFDVMEGTLIFRKLKLRAKKKKTKWRRFLTWFVKHTTGWDNERTR